jgi:hypothetical protein
MITKACSNPPCKKVKLITEFSGVKKKHSWCKECNNKFGRLYRAQKPERKRADQKLYRQRHPEKVNLNTANRDALKKKRKPKWLTVEHLNQIGQFYADAAYLTAYTKVVFQVDHIIPILGKNVSGLHVPWNLQLLTAKENASKGNRHED